jgi:hypothetical protein
MMQEILSIGKSIKIVKYLEKNWGDNIQESEVRGTDTVNFDNFFEIFKDKLKENIKEQKMVMN